MLTNGVFDLFSEFRPRRDSLVSVRVCFVKEYNFSFSV